MNLLLVLLLLWNPIVLWQYYQSMVIAFLLSITIVSIGLAISRVRSLRLKVWAFNLVTIASILFHAEVIFTMVYAYKEIPNLYELHGKYYFNKPYLDQQFNDIGLMIYPHRSRRLKNVIGYLSEIHIHKVLR